MNTESIDYLAKPFEGVKTLNQESAYAGQGFVTSNPRMLRIIAVAQHVAQTDVPRSHPR